MDELPLPLTRTDLYLAKAAGMAGITLPDEPIGREEQFLAVIAGDTSVELPAPANLTELWLAFVAGEALTDEMELEGAYYIGPQKVDVRFFAVAGGMDGVVAPAPQNRTEQYWAKIAEIRPIHGVLKYATGTNIYLTDVVRGIDELQFVYGDTAQQTYSGKNLSPIEPGTYTSADLTYEKSADGTVTINGTSTAVSACTMTSTFPINLLAGQTYILSASNPVANSNVIVRFMDENGNPFPGSAMKLTGANKYTAITPTNDSTPLRVQIRIDSGVSLTNFIVKPMVEKGSTATAYEPYVGGVPAPNPSYPQDVNVVTGEQTVGVTSKNLCQGKNYSALGIDTLYDEETGIFSVSGTPSATTVIISANIYQNITAGTYTFSTTKASTVAKRIRAFHSDNTYEEISIAANTTSKTGTFTKDIVRYNLLIDGLTTGVAMADSFKLQLEHGTTVSAYQLYQSANYNVSLKGKNLFDINNLSASGITIENGVASGTAQSFNTAFGAAGISLPFNDGQYTVSVVGYTDGNQSTEATAGLGFRVGYTDATFSNYVYWNNSDTTAVTKTFTTALGKTPEAIYFSFAGKGQNIWHLSQIQVEAGSSASEYSPYYNYELCKIGTYQDYIYKSGDDWYVHKETNKILLDGSTETWHGTTFHDKFRVQLNVPDIFIISANADFVGVSDHFYKDAKVLGPDINDGMFCQFHDTNQVYWCAPSSCTTLSEFRTWLSNNNTLFYYQLATPTDTKITDATLIAELNAIDSATLPKPDANITLTATSPNLPASIKISYYGEEE